MFTVYVDDSGTADDQKSLVAAALIVPGIRIEAMESEWENLRLKHEFTDLHASECAWRNVKSQFSKWDDDKVSKVFARTRQISKKYGVKAISYALKRSDYSEALTEEWKKVGGRYHYTWAFRWLIRQLEKWHARHNFASPFEFVFDWQENKNVKEEIERVLSQEESVYPGRYEGHYSFKHREQFAGLQCVDLLAWTHYQAARRVFEGTPLNSFAEANWRDFSHHPRIPHWMEMFTDRDKQTLIETMRKDQSDWPSTDRRQRWMEEYKENRRKANKRPPQ